MHITSPDYQLPSHVRVVVAETDHLSEQERACILHPP